MSLLLNEKLMKIAEGITPDNLDSSCDTLLKCGIISLEEAQQIRTYFMEKEREELLKKHEYSIYRGRDNKWYSYIKNGDKRKKIKRNTKKEVEDIVIKNLKDGEALTIQDVFEEYLHYKKECGLKQSTIDRYRACFKRHYVAMGHQKKDIKKLSPEWFCDFLETEVGRCKLTAKGAANLKGVTKSILKRAKRRHLISYGPSEVMDDLDLRPVQKHIEDDKQVFTKSELPRLIQYLIDNPDVHNLCILLMVVSGVRVGELTTLKYSDFITATSFNIRRCQTRYKTDDGYVCEVQDNPKTSAGNRTVFIDEAFDWIVTELRKLRPFAEYLATNDEGERLTANAIRKRLYRICDCLGIDRKSPHKCRKTHASILLAEGVNAKVVASMEGHRNQTTTYEHYDYDRSLDKEKQKIMNNIVAFRVG